MKEFVLELNGESIEVNKAIINTSDGMICILANHNKIVGTGSLISYNVGEMNISVNLKGLFYFENNVLKFG